MIFGNQQDKTAYTLNLSIATTEEHVTVVSNDCVKSICEITDTWKKTKNSKFVKKIGES